MFAFVTLVTSDGYLPGALTLAASLKEIHRDTPSPFDLVALVTPESVDVASIKLLRRAFDHVVGVEIIAQEDEKNLKLLGRLDLNTVLTKLHVFRLTQYSKVIFLDADVLPIRPLSHLFSLPHKFSAVPDVGWPDIFNSGVLVLTPAESSFTELNELLKTKGTWDGGDQGILNEWRGNDWNRLSFTYNTTPTAAYTYAPAYERFGSQISAIHFIGPNKPWKTLPWRAPGTKLATEDSGVQQAYDYSSLVDRWYAVYDKHFRSQVSVVPETEFGVKRYISAWDETSQKPAEIVQASVSHTLGLDDLKRVALQGMGNVVSAPSNPGEGAYSSMPLEGRLDLMRQQMAAEPVFSKPYVPAASSVSQAPSYPQVERWHTLPTLGADEIPPTPHLQALPYPQVERWHTLPTPGPDEIPPAPHLQPQSLPEIPVKSLHYMDQPHKNQPETHEQKKSEYSEPPRPASPPMLIWNPAVEPPPNNPPSKSAFPTHTYFPNIWDNPPSKENDQVHQSSDIRSSYVSAPGTAPTPESGVFFNPPPAVEIPSSLRQQGHYFNVIGADKEGHMPTPDRRKVKSVFPWENKPRQMPGRVFPESDAPQAATFLQTPETHVNATTEQDGGDITPRAGIPNVEKLSPLPVRGLPTTLSFTNAWDTVPSIQTYATKLVRPQAPPISPAFSQNEWRRGGRDSPKALTADTDSRDGDDEDSEEEHTIVTPSRSRSASGSSGKGKQKQYAVRGVQTDSPELRSIGVQVSINVQPIQQPQVIRKSTSSQSSGTSAESVNEVPALLPSVLSPGRPATKVGSNNFKPFITGRLTSPREFNFPGSSPVVRAAPALTSPISVSSSPPLTKLTPPVLSPGSRTSPGSSIGPLSPPDSQHTLLDSPVRKGVRVWDPKRGVDVFKRGSEEVLARFLRMGSWEDDASPAK